MDDVSALYADALSGRVARAQAQRASLLTAIEETRMARALTFADDEHDPDGSMASLDQVRDAALLQGTERTLAKLADAQRRLASRTYGVCDICDLGISTERLLARPETRRCVACAADAVRRRRRSG